MLIPFEIDTDSFEDLRNNTISISSKASHDHVLDLWLKSGILTYNGDSFNHSVIFNSINTLPASLKSKWLQAIQKYPLIKSSAIEWDGQVNKDLINKIKDKPIVLIVDETKAYVDFGVPEGDYSIIDEKNQIEVIKFPHISHSSFFKKAQEKSNSHFKRNENFKTLWLERFHWLTAAENIKNIAIIDRYALENHVKWDVKQGLSGLERFLKFVDNSATSIKNIKLYTAWFNNPNGQLNFQVQEEFKKSIELILKNLSNKKIIRISVHILHPKDISEESHARHIRFGDMHVWELDKGLSCFSGNVSCKSKLTATLKTGLRTTSEYIQKESELESINKKAHLKFEIKI